MGSSESAAAVPVASSALDCSLISTSSKNDERQLLDDDASSISSLDAIFSWEMAVLSSHKLADDDAVAKVAADAVSLSMPLMDEEEEEERGLLGILIFVALGFIVLWEESWFVVALLYSNRKSDLMSRQYSCVHGSC